MRGFGVFDALAADSDDDVARTQSGFFRRRAGFDAADAHAFAAVIERFTVFVFEGAQAEAAAARAGFAVAANVVEVADFGFDGFFFAVAQQFDFDFFAYRGGGDVGGQVGRFAHRFAVVLEDDVAVFDAGFGGRRVFFDGGDERALRFFHAEGFGERLVESLDAHAEPAAHDFAFVFQLVGDVFRHVDRDGEGEAVKGAAAAVNLRVDGDDFAFAVKERAAGVAGVDGGVGLDEGDVVAAWQVARDGADDALGRGVAKAEG